MTFIRYLQILKVRYMPRMSKIKYLINIDIYLLVKNQEKNIKIVFKISRYCTLQNESITNIISIGGSLLSRRRRQRAFRTRVI